MLMVLVEYSSPHVHQVMLASEGGFVVCILFAASRLYVTRGIDGTSVFLFLWIALPYSTDYIHRYSETHDIDSQGLRRNSCLNVETSLESTAAKT